MAKIVKHEDNNGEVTESESIPDIDYIGELDDFLLHDNKPFAKLVRIKLLQFTEILDSNGFATVLQTVREVTCH
jgi:hypothetical protein